jgi:predicted amidohydrolase YtcJ
MATGTNAEILRLAGSHTRRIELDGRTVIPGLIDNHAHFLRAAQHWGLEVRWDGIASRREALAMLRERVRLARPGEWITVLGGWSFDQFTDDQRPFDLVELDQIAPGNPLALQFIYFRVFLNSRALDVLGLRDTQTKVPNAQVVRAETGEPTGVLEGRGAAPYLRARLPEGDAELRVGYARRLMCNLNAMGLTAFIDWGGRGSSADPLEPFRTLHKQGELTVRTYYGTSFHAATAEQTEKIVARIADMQPFQGDDYLDQIGYGETVFPPLHDSPFAKNVRILPEQERLWWRIGQAVADRGLHLSVHANARESIESFLTQIESINTVRPVRALRWSLAHVRGLEPAHIERLRRLGMAVQAHSQATISGAIALATFGERAYDRPPLRTIQESGIPWGLGSDSNGAAPANPFLTLWWATTGRMIGGKVVLKQTITREQALIAHTRNNAYFAFREGELGSLQRGRYADLVVLDRDYLAVPADQIKDLRPVLTMVGGKVVYRKSKVLHPTGTPCDGVI